MVHNFITKNRPQITTLARCLDLSELSTTRPNFEAFSDADPNPRSAIPAPATSLCGGSRQQPPAARSPRRGLRRRGVHEGRGARKAPARGWNSTEAATVPLFRGDGAAAGARWVRRGMEKRRRLGRYEMGTKKQGESGGTTAATASKSTARSRR